MDVHSCLPARLRGDRDVVLVAVAENGKALIMLASFEMTAISAVAQNEGH